jgi:hypothetical protein
MLKDRTPFTGRSVVSGRAAVKFPAAVTVVDEIRCAEEGDCFAFVPPQPGEPVRFRKVDKLPTLRFSRG